MLLPNLLNDFDRLAGLLPEQVRAGGWLNAFLLAAGLNQIVEDYLHPDPLSLGRVAKHLGRLPGAAGTIAAGLANRFGSGLCEVWARTRTAIRLARWQRTFAGLVRDLAHMAALSEGARAKRLNRVEGGLSGPGIEDDSHAEQLLLRTEELLRDSRSFPEGLRRSILRLPSCFRSFDQHPKDLKRLVDDFSREAPDRSVPVISVGLRTSGSYLAPFVAAYLEEQGYKRVELLTLRPGRHLLPSERAALARLGRAGGVALVTDDPPATGRSLAEAGAELERAGIGRASIVLLLQLFGPESARSLPELMRRDAAGPYRSLVLPWEDWEVNSRLAPEQVRQTLAEVLWPDLRVVSVEQIERPARRWVRSHAHGLYRVEVAGAAGNGATRRLMIAVKGAGLGYFGEHELAVAERLGEYLPQTYGLRDGLLYRAWLDDNARMAPGASVSTGLAPEIAGPAAKAIAGYVVARARRLPAERDSARDIMGQRPAWEVTANLLSTAYGRMGAALRPVALDAAVQRLLAVERPAVIDGAMDLVHWFVGPDGAGALLKVDPAERDFSNLDLACYDPVFDLAGASASCAGDGWPKELRRAYEAASGETVDEERWLLYQLLQLWDRGRTGYMEDRVVDRAASRALQRYYSARYLSVAREGRATDGAGSQPTPAAAGLVALDLDGVLETQVLGFPGLTPASANALSALHAHGYQPVLVTGRSLDEARERCDAYGLAGGAAEYGSVVYLREGDRKIELLRPEECDALERLRAALERMPGVEVDPDYTRVVRAFRMKPAGGWRERRALTPNQVEAALGEAGVDDLVRYVPGYFQTDFVASRIDKGIGLRVLAAELEQAAAQGAGAGQFRPGEGHSRQDALVALAVGDTEEDIPMLALAKHAWAPGNANAALRRTRVRVAHRPYQVGLAESVQAVLGHKPGGCPECRTPALPDSARLLADVLAAQENGRLGMAWHALHLAVAARLAHGKGQS